MKKFLSCLLVLVMAIALVPQGLFTIDVHAATATSGTSGNCTWTLDGTALTISGNGVMSSYGSWIPAPWGKTITSVTISNGVTSIGGSAFSGCSNLTSVTIPNSVTSIDNEAFSGCTSLTSIVIPDSVTSISSKAFRNCSGLTSLTIPDSITSIGQETFAYCSGLTSIIIPNSVSYLGDCAFMGCSGLTSVTISNLVTYIRRSTFQYCSGLTSVTIPNSVTDIGSNAFSGCFGLTTVIIPDSITFINDHVFYGCSNLTSVCYEGNNDDWDNIECSNIGNDYLLNATWYYNYCGEGTHTYSSGTLCDICQWPITVTNIELMQHPKTDYVASELFDPTGAVLRLHFNDGKSEDITIDHYDFYNDFLNTYYCKKLDAYSGFVPADSTPSSEAFLFFDHRIDFNFNRSVTRSISINDDAKNLVITITCLDNTTHTLTALGFIPRMGDSCPDGNHLSAFGELYTDQGIYFAGFIPDCDGSIHMEINGISSNSLPNGCDWYNMYMEKQWPADGGNALWNMLSHFRSFNGIITNENIDPIINYTTYVNSLEITDKSDGYTLPNGSIALMGWYKGEDLRNAIMKNFAIDSVDLSLSIHYDSENDRYPVLGNGVANDIHSLPSLFHKNGYWEMYWDEIGSYPYSYARYDDEGRILRFSHGVPIITPGDLTDDLNIDTLDGLMLLRYLNGWDIDIEAPDDAMDVNADGTVDTLDGLLLLRYLNGWDVTLAQ